MKMPVNIVVEDYLSEVALRKIVEVANKDLDIINCYCRGGYGYIKRNINGFNNAAKGIPFIILTDLISQCPPLQIREWISNPVHPKLLFRIAVMEIESWLLADKMGFASFLGINSSLIADNVDSIDDPKQYLINLAKRSRKRTIREDITPRLGYLVKVGPNYNGRLSYFVNNMWNISVAKTRSESLQRAVNAIDNFNPEF